MLAGADAKFEWIKQDNNGTYYIDLTNATIDDYRDLNSWTANTIKNTSTDDPDHTFISALNDDFGGDYTRGYNRGEGIAKGL